jgi:hypothetical protein
VRRSMASMLVALGCLSTPLAAQDAFPMSTTSWGLGLAATMGKGWQIEGGEIGVQRRLRAPLGAMSVAARFGSFIDEGAFIGGARGFVAALVLGARTGSATLFEVGTEEAPTRVAFDVSVEAAGYLGANSPLPQGGGWVAAAVLPGLRFGETGGLQYRIVIGPTVFFGGGEPDVRAFLGIRFESPLAPRERRP